MSGPAGTGKSRALLEKIHWAATKYDGARILLVRKTRTSLTTSTLITYENLVLPPGHAQVTYQGAEYPNGSVIVFGGLDKARFRRQVVPGDELVLEVQLGRMSARAGKGSGRALVGGEVACECELLFVIVDA